MGKKRTPVTATLVAALGHGAASAIVTGVTAMAPSGIAGLESGNTEFDYRAHAPQLQAPGEPMLLAGGGSAWDTKFKKKTTISGGQASLITQPTPSSTPQFSATPQSLQAPEPQPTAAPSSFQTAPPQAGQNTPPFATPSPSIVSNAQQNATGGGIGGGGTTAAAIVGGILVITNTKTGTASTASTGSTGN